jgi:hypothetical protein
LRRSVIYVLGACFICLALVSSALARTAEIEPKPPALTVKALAQKGAEVIFPRLKPTRIPVHEGGYEIVTTGAPGTASVARCAKKRVYQEAGEPGSLAFRCFTRYHNTIATDGANGHLIEEEVTDAGGNRGRGHRGSTPGE